MEQIVSTEPAGFLSTSRWSQRVIYQTKAASVLQQVTGSLQVNYCLFIMTMYV